MYKEEEEGITSDGEEGHTCELYVAVADMRQ